MKDFIYIYHNYEQEGPYTTEQVEDMLESGSITPISLAWKEGMTGWAPINTILTPRQEVEVALSPPPPPPLPVRKPPPPPVRKPPSPISKSSPTSQPIGPKGVGGWLGFFCFTLTTLFPLYTIFEIFSSWGTASLSFEQFPSLKTAIIWEYCGRIAFVFYGLFVGSLIAKGSPNGRNVAKKYLIITLLGWIGIHVVALILMGDLPSEFNAEITISISIVGKIVYFLIWWFYFKKSKRVRNTYGTV